MSGAGKFKLSPPSWWTNSCITSVMKKTERTPCWTERLNGGNSWEAAPTVVPSFNSICKPIGRRRRWREVVERAYFNVQLRELRDPVAVDDIGMALTEALHQAIETELEGESSDPPIIFSILPSRLTGSPTSTKRPILPWGSFCNAPLDWIRCWPR